MINQYRYSIDLTYQFQNKQVSIDHTNIHSLMIDYDYDEKNMPIILMQVSVDKNVLDDMIKNSNKKTITMTISKYIHNSNPKINEIYIREQFIYFLPNDLNPTKELDYGGKNRDKEDVYRQVTIGLMKLELINNNMKVINDIVTDTTLINVLLKYMSHMKILIEPVRNVKIDRFIIPPTDTVTNFVKYIDSYFTIYKNKYRLFYDYDKTYLLSSSGIPIPSRNEYISSVIINVNNTVVPESKVQGMSIDTKQKAYIIDIDGKDINLFEDKATERNYSNIIGIDSNGNYNKVNIAKADKSINNVRIERINNGNLNKVNSMKDEIDNNSTIINVVKTELDTSIFTINKEYMIKNYDQLADKNGRFLLARKREIYVRDDQNFILTNVLTFRKVIS